MPNRTVFKWKEISRSCERHIENVENLPDLMKIFCLASFNMPSGGLVKRCDDDGGTERGKKGKSRGKTLLKLFSNNVRLSRVDHCHCVRACPPMSAAALENAYVCLLESEAQPGQAS